MKNSIWPWLLALLVAGVAGIAWYLYRQQEQAPPPVAQAPAKPAAPAAPPPNHYPIEDATPATAPAKPLPSLDDSDEDAQAALGGLVDRQALAELFQLKGLIRRIVATVDNLPREKVSGRLSAFKRVPGQFATAGQGAELSLSPANYARYVPYAHLAAAVDARQLVAVYRQLYPLFQQAYADLGYPDAYFNDRLVQVIDNLLASPTPPGPVRLEQPNVLFQYADPELESLSAGQKIMIRMGPENAAMVRNKLQEIRVLLASRAHRP